MKLDKRPKCTICKGELTEDNLFHFVPFSTKKGGRLVHDRCHTDQMSKMDYHSSVISADQVVSDPV